MTPEEQVHFENRFAQAVDSIEEYHAIGREAQRRGSGKFVRGVHRQLSEKYGVKTSLISRARKFASEYTEERLQEVIQLCREANFIPGREMFATLATVPASERPTFEKAMITEQWPIRKLKMEVLERFGKRSNGCKRHALPKSLPEAVYHVGRMGKHWDELSYLFKEATRRADYYYTGDVPFALSRELRYSINLVTNALNDFYEELKAERESRDGPTAA